mgnify:CR=1 FL=1
MVDIQAVYANSVIETTHRGERQIGLFDRLLLDRIIFLGGAIDSTRADFLIGQLLFLESMDPDKDVHLYVNSPGGAVQPALAIYDTMQYVRCPISTICIGQASNMAALLLSAGAKGKRFTLPHARIHLHQPAGAFQGQATDVDIQARELVFIKDTLIQLFARHTGLSEERVREDTDRDKFLRGAEAVEYGLVDQVFVRKELHLVK